MLASAKPRPHPQRQVEIYEEVIPVAPPSPKELKDVNGRPISRLKRLSVSLGFSDVLALQQQTMIQQANGANSPNSPVSLNSSNNSPNSPTFRRASNAVVGAGAYNNLSNSMSHPSRRMSRRMTMHAGWDRSRRQGSISHIATADPKSLPNSPSYTRTDFERNSMLPSPRHQRGSMALPALGDVSEARDSLIREEDDMSPGEPASPNAQQVTHTTSNNSNDARSTTSGLPPSPTSPGTPGGSRKLKRTRQSQIIRQTSGVGGGCSSLSPLDEVDGSSPLTPPAESATDAALRALEGKPTAPTPASSSRAHHGSPHDDIPQYLIDAHRRLSTLAPPPPPRDPRSVSPGQRVVRKLKALSIGAIGGDSPPIPHAPTAAAAAKLQSRFQEELPVPERNKSKISRARSSSRERLGQAARKLKTMSVYVAGREVPPVLELQRSPTQQAFDKEALGPDVSAEKKQQQQQQAAGKERCPPRPAPERAGSGSNRVSRFLRTQSELARDRYSPSPRGSERRPAFLSREPSSAAASSRERSSKYRMASPSSKPSAKGQEVDYLDEEDASSGDHDHHPIKPQHKTVYGVRETTHAGEAKRGSRFKRISTHVARLFQ